MRCFVHRMTLLLENSPALKSLRGLQCTVEVLHNLWSCLDDARKIYDKYKDGWNWRRGWMTPAWITAKANAQHQRLRDAFQELQLVLDFKNLDVVQGINAHLGPVPAAPARPSSAAAASAAAPAVPTAPPPLAHHSSSPAQLIRESSADDAVLQVALALSLRESASPPPAPSPPCPPSPPGQSACAHGGFL